MLDKLLATFIYPLPLSIYLLLIVGLWNSHQRLGQGLLCLALGLWIASMPVLSDYWRGAWESAYPPELAHNFPQGTAIVVLGGGINPAYPPRFPYPDLGSASDRVWMAARLYHAGKAPQIIASGGYIPWAGPHGAEADAMAAFLVDLGVPDHAILRESHSLTTHENAEQVAELLGVTTEERRQILLVTSALHMRRALATFQKQGIVTIPVAADHEITAANLHPLRFLPDAGALEGTTRLIREMMGLWIYRWRGWAV